MTVANYHSVLFACDHNAVRSPMAEGLMKKLYGMQVYVQSVGVKHDMEIDGFTIAVCEEIGVELTQHRARSFDEMEEWGDTIDGFDLIIALSPAAQRQALEFTRQYAIEVDYWPITDPTPIGRNREEKLDAYRATRSQITQKIVAKFGDEKMLAIPVF